MTSDYQNETMQERMARVRSARKAKVEMVQNAPVPSPVARNRSRGMTDEEAFLNQTAKPTRLRDQRFEGDAEVNTTHYRPGTVLMWKPGQDGNYVPRTVSDSARSLNLDNGWAIHCPDCGTNHEDSPLPPSDPNACPARDPVQVRLCPVCRKRIPDNLGFTMGTGKGSTDPNVIADDPYGASTPATRTRIQLNIHLWERHPRQAQMMNVPPIPQGWSNPANLPESVV